MIILCVHVLLLVRGCPSFITSVAFDTSSLLTKNLHVHVDKHDVKRGSGYRSRLAIII